MCDFSKRLKQLRTEHNLTQKELASATNIGMTTIQSYELNLRIPSITIAATLADYFNVSLDYLCGRSDER